MPGPGDRERGSPESERKGLSSLGQAYQKASPYLAASTSLVVAVGFFTWLGVWLDGKFGTTPWLTLLGVVIGMVGGFVSFLTKVLPKKR